jgi:hypothetical protein
MIDRENKDVQATDRSHILTDELKTARKQKKEADEIRAREEKEARKEEMKRKRQEN